MLDIDYEILKHHTQGNWFSPTKGYRSCIESTNGKQVASVNFFHDPHGKVSVTGKEHEANTLLITIAPLLLQEVLELRKTQSILPPKKRIGGTQNGRSEPPGKNDDSL